MRTVLLLGLVLAAARVQAAPPAPSTDAVPPGLDGDWTVDLGTPDAPDYTRPMHLHLRPDGTVDGDFYESRIEAGRWKTARGRTCASFRTTDGAGPYHTAVCLSGDIAVGQTWAEHRNFLFNWNATRAPAAPSAP